MDTKDSMRDETRESTQAAAGPYEIRRNALIPLSDGVRIAADIYVPTYAGPHPALVSYYPYHKDDLIGAMFEYARHYFAARGYACVLADYRGTGGSEGVCTDTFDTQSEGRDGAEIVEWTAGQDWCDGAVGVWGMSYGGIISLAIGAQAPPHLKAIAPLYGAPDIWEHFVAPGGCPNCLGNYARESFMLAMDLAPPLFQDPHGHWLEVWKERLARLETQGVRSLTWQARHEYDQHWQSRAIPVEQITAPAFFVGGWRDIFPEAMTSAFARISAPKRLLMGPWVHTLPDWSPYQPVDWLAEVTRWWNRWLRDEANGADDPPTATIFVQGSERWRHEATWPIEKTRLLTLYPNADGALRPKANENGFDTYSADPTVGTAAGLWDPLGTGAGYPLEQAEDDLRSLTYTSAPLTVDTEIIGSPEATLHIALTEGTQLQIVAKLTAVAPDGSSTLVSTGWLNASHRNGHDQTMPPEPGVVTRYMIPMWATAYHVPCGHRLRLSLACADFPRIWPTHTNPMIALHRGAETTSLIQIPIVPAPDGDLGNPPIARPQTGIDRAPSIVKATPHWEIKRDCVRASVSTSLGASLQLQLPTGGGFSLHHLATASVSRSRPDGAAVEAEARIDVEMPNGEHIKVDTRSRFTRNTMLLTGRVRINDRMFFDKRWQN